MEMDKEHEEARAKAYVHNLEREIEGYKVRDMPAELRDARIKGCRDEIARVKKAKRVTPQREDAQSKAETEKATS